MEHLTANTNLANVLETMHKVVQDREQGIRVADNMIALEQKTNCLTLEFPVLLEFQGMTFASADHLLTYFKALSANDSDALVKITNTKNTATAKTIPIKGFQPNRWKKVEYKAVETATAIKLKQHPQISEFLKNTGTKRIVYASKSDTFFGCGLPITDDNLWFPQFWKGQNALGAILSTLRRTV